MPLDIGAMVATSIRFADEQSTNSNYVSVVCDGLIAQIVQAL